LLAGTVILAAVGPAQVRADLVTGNQTHRVKFFLDPGLAGVNPGDPVPQSLKDNLTQYFEEIRTILERQTVRQFVFDADGDVSVTTTQPHSQSYQGTTPLWQVQNHEIWIHARLTDNPAYGTYGGNAGLDQSGAGVASNLRWDQVYNPSTVTVGNATEQYWRQIDHIVHEFEHVLGAGIGEYYSLNFVNDNTGVGPDMDIALRGDISHDPYWSTRTNYLADPLQLNAYNNEFIGRPTTLQDLRDKVRLADTTVAVLDAGMRGRAQESVPDMQNVAVEVRDAATGALIPSAALRVWNIKTVGDYLPTEYTVNSGAAGGQFWFDWDPLHDQNSPVLFNNYDMLKLLKVSAPGYDDAGMWYSIFDAQNAKLVGGQSSLLLTVNLNSSAAPEPSTWSLLAVAAGALAIALRRRSAGKWYS